MHKIKNILRYFISLIYSFYYGFPQKKLKVIGVTGTDGKTTTSNFLYHLLTKSGYKVGLVSTINAKIGEKEIDTGFHVTSPDPQVVIHLLAHMVKEGAEYAILEVTSHGLSQNRFGNVKFDYGVITNITPEHLDYHKTYSDYLLSKSKLIIKSTLTFINKDDKQSYTKLKQIAFESYKHVIDYSLSEFKKSNQELAESLRAVLSKNFPGIYNQQNAIAALSVLSRINVKPISVKEINLLKGISPLEGRFNRVDNSLGINIIIDFAHTPNALENVLTEVRNLRVKDAKIISVFGCAGLRDSSKREPMGKIAGNIADTVIITAEDPRTEELDKINEQIVKGVECVNGDYIIEKDRQVAITKAIR